MASWFIGILIFNVFLLFSFLSILPRRQQDFVPIFLQDLGTRGGQQNLLNDNPTLVFIFERRGCLGGAMAGVMRAGKGFSGWGEPRRSPCRPWAGGRISAGMTWTLDAEPPCFQTPVPHIRPLPSRDG